MSKYIIKSYEPAFIEEQVEVGKEVVKGWKYLIQTPTEELKQLYSQPDFDPSTRLYCFQNNKLVGFLPGKVIEENKEKKGFIRFPFVLADHREAEDLLMEKIIEVFNNKGLAKVQGVAGTIWGESLNIAKRWDFKEVENRATAYILNVDEYKTNQEEESFIVPFDFDQDIEPLAEIYNKEYNTPAERIKAEFESLRNSQQVIEFSVIKEKGKISALVLLMKENGELATQYHIYVKDTKLYKNLQNRIVQRCKEKGVKFIQIFFRKHTFQYIPEYEKLGFKFDSKTILMERKSN